MTSFILHCLPFSLLYVNVLQYRQHTYHNIQYSKHNNIVALVFSH